MRKVVILGTGPAGLTAAIYTARANLEPLIIEGNEPGGQLTLTTEVENYPGFAEGIMGPELMENMRAQAARFGTEFRSGWATAVDFSRHPYRITVDENEVIEAESIIISTGASAKLLGLPGEREAMGRGVSTCATCDGFFYTGKKVLVVGGGDSAMEEANFLTKFAEVTVVHRRNELRASKIMQERARANPKISWALNVSPIEVVSGPKGFQALKIKDNESGEERLLEADGMFVAIGHTPNTGFLANQIETDEVGYIQTKPGGAETNIPGVFACGDVQDHKYRQAVTAAGTGCMAALDCERWLESSAAHDWSQTLNK